MKAKKKVRAYIIEQQREYTHGSTAYNLLRKLETVIPNMIEESIQSIKPIEVTDEEIRELANLFWGENKYNEHDFVFIKFIITKWMQSKGEGEKKDKVKCFTCGYDKEMRLLTNTSCHNCPTDKPKPIC